MYSSLKSVIALKFQDYYASYLAFCVFVRFPVSGKFDYNKSAFQNSRTGRRVHPSTLLHK
jgi:hypothetical protein